MTTPRAIARPAASSSSIPQLIFGDLWEYDPAPETADPKLKVRYDLFVGGKFVAPKSGKYFDSINPATEETLAQIARELAGKLDGDQIQDIYQPIMDSDGYFSPLDEDPS